MELIRTIEANPHTKIKAFWYAVTESEYNNMLNSFKWLTRPSNTVISENNKHLRWWCKYEGKEITLLKMKIGKVLHFQFVYIAHEEINFDLFLRKDSFC